MSDRKATTQKLSLLLEKMITDNYDTRSYVAKEVTFDYSSSQTFRVDYMKFKPVNNTVSGIEKGDFYCYEVKSSVEDFHSKNGHNFIGDYNYYVMPEEVFEKVKSEIPYDIGVYVLQTSRISLGLDLQYLISKSKARRRNRNRPANEMLLMMFRSANREVIKMRRQEVIENGI